MFTFLFKIKSYKFSPKGTGQGDVSYNVRRNVIGALPLEGKITYHLFTLDPHASKSSAIVKLCRKSAWHPKVRAHKSSKLVH